MRSWRSGAFLDALLDPIQALVGTIQPAICARQALFHVRHAHFQVMHIRSHQVQFGVNRAQVMQNEVIRLRHV